MAEKHLTYRPGATIDETLRELDSDKVLVVTDANVERHVFPLLAESETIENSPKIVIGVGEESKNIETVGKVWETLEKSGATRRSVVMNVGGGVVTDLGGFAASTFKRGIRTVNFPTTLLGAVDAATGGKTGINFLGLKNEIGTFHLPSKVIISPLPFKTLPFTETLSGYAEMIKTALISDAKFYNSLLEFEEVVGDDKKLGKAVEKCVSVKDDIVEQDPKEKGLRKVLNFGHTAGHAFESICMRCGREMTHGKAVAHGILVALILSHLMLGLDSKELHIYARFLKDRYSGAPIKCDEIDEVLDMMKSDKKNRTFGQPLFTLLRRPGEPEINCSPSERELGESLEIYLDMAR